MMTPLRCVTGGGDQENTTFLSPGSAPSLSGGPDGAKGVEYAVITCSHLIIYLRFEKNGQCLVKRSKHRKLLPQVYKTSGKIISMK